jgi:hypothetical protein
MRKVNSAPQEPEKKEYTISEQVDRLSQALEQLNFSLCA